MPEYVYALNNFLRGRNIAFEAGQPTETLIGKDDQ